MKRINWCLFFIVCFFSGKVANGAEKDPLYRITIESDFGISNHCHGSFWEVHFLFGNTTVNTVKGVFPEIRQHYVYDEITSIWDRYCQCNSVDITKEDCWYQAANSTLTGGRANIPVDVGDNEIVSSENIGPPDETLKLTLKELEYLQKDNIFVVSPIACNKVLPDDKMTVSSKYNSSVVHWEYQVPAIDAVTWRKLPINANGTVSFCGNDIGSGLGISFIDSILKNNYIIKVKATYRLPEGYYGNTGIVSGIGLFAPALSMPRITHVEMVNESCYKANDGKVMLTLDRDLYPGEELTVGCPANIGGFIKKDVLIKASDNKIIVIDSLRPTALDTIRLKAGRIRGANNQFIEYEKCGYWELPLSKGMTFPHPYQVHYKIDSARRYTMAVTSRNVNCYNGRDGQLEISINDTEQIATYRAVINKIGQDTSEVKWIQQSPSLFDGYGAGTYTLQVQDEKGCFPDKQGGEKDSMRVLIVAAPSTPLQVVAVKKQNPRAYGYADGELEVAAVGGNGDYLFTWSGNSSSQTGNMFTAEAISDGSYTLVVRDGNYDKAIDKNGCELDTVILFTEPPLLELFPQITDSIYCNAAATGGIRLTATGGYLESEGSYEFSLTRGLLPLIADSDGVYKHLQAGSYVGEVKDGNGIVKRDTIVMEQPEQIIISDQKTDIRCYGGKDGQLVVSAIGGSAPYTVQLMQNEQLLNAISIGIGDTATFKNLDASTYTYMFTDKYGCTSSSHAAAKVHVIAVPESPVTFLEPQLQQPAYYSGSNGKIVIPVTGYYGELDDTYYKFYLFDTSGVLVFSELLANKKILDYSGASSGSYYARVEAHVYSQSGNETDRRGCYDTLTVYLPQPPKLIPYVKQIDTIHCNGGATASVHLSGEGGCFSGEKIYKFRIGQLVGIDTLWKKQEYAPDTIYVGLSAGNYVVAIMDGNAITAVKEFMIAEPLPLQARVNVKKVNCYNGRDGEIEVQLEGGTIPYLLHSSYNGVELADKPVQEEGAAFLRQLGTGTYTIRVTDSNNCEAALNGEKLYQGNYVVTMPDAPVSLQIVQQKNPLAFHYTDGLLEVSTQGGTPADLGYSLQWMYNDTDITHRVRIAGNKAMTDSLGAGNYYICIRDSLYAKVESTNTIDLRGCFDTISIRLVEPPLLTVTGMIRDSIRCHGYASGTIVFSADGGYLAPEKEYRFRLGEYRLPGEIDWLETQYTHNRIRTNMVAGTYAVEVIDDNGIRAQAKLIIPEPPAYNLHFSTSPSSCTSSANGQAAVSVMGASPPYSYNWFTSDNEAPFSHEEMIDHIPAGVYLVKVFDRWGCSASAYTVVGHTGMDASYALYHPLCEGDKNGAIMVDIKGGETPYSYVWSQGETGETDGFITLASVGAGTYALQITDAARCKEIYNYTLLDPSLQRVGNLPEQLVLCKGQTYLLQPEIATGISYQWYKDGVPFAQTPDIEVSEGGVYRLSVLTDNRNGCLVEHQINVVKRTDEVITAFAVASKVVRNKEIKIVNISYPEPEKMEWVLPSETNDYSVLSATAEVLNVVFYKNGSYTFGLTGSTGDCVANTFKTVEVVDEYELPYEPDGAYPLIIQYSAYPNPVTTEIVNVLIELREPADVLLSMYDIIGLLKWQKTLTGTNYYHLQIPVADFNSGWYFLLLTVGREQTTRRILIP